MSEKLTNRQIDQYIGVSDFANRLGKNEPSLTEDSAEAYEVAHATKDLEEKHADNLRYYAPFAEKYAELDDEGNVTNRWAGSGDEFAAMRHRSAVSTRMEANNLGNQVSEAYKNKKGNDKKDTITMSNKDPYQETYDSSYKFMKEKVREVSAGTNGSPELLDSAEAYAVAHATKEHEEKAKAAIGAYAMASYHHDEDSLRSAAVAAMEARVETDKIANYVSEAFKNGAEFLDLSSDKFTAALAEAPVYRKAAIVKARKAVPGEVVVTVTPDGVEEGRNTAGEDDHVVTGANGADFILPGEKFNKLYEETEESGVFQSRGMARIIDNPTGKKIGILAPWGEMQYGDSESKIAVQYDPQNPDVVGTDRYILDKTEFAAYKEVESIV